MALLGVNIDHIATVRQARGTKYPEPLQAALLAEEAGADGITIHLREDRRHIRDEDVAAIKDSIRTRLNLEMALTDEMLQIACAAVPAYVCLVPEKRQELTTEGGLNLADNPALQGRVRDANQQLAALGIKVSLFIDPEQRQLDAAKNTGCPVVELHTGSYAEAAEAGDDKAAEQRRQELFHAAEHAHSLGLKVNAGHGLTYDNVGPIVQLPHLYELNIGHAIVARALFVGIKQAVAEMKQLVAG